MRTEILLALRDWLEGKTIEFYTEGIGWRELNGPADVSSIPFHDSFTYRRKPEPVKISGWLNVYQNSVIYFHENRESADTHSDPDRIACIKIEMQVDHGEGL